MNYYRYLVKKGIQFDFICMYEELAYQDEITAMGGKIYCVSNVKKRPGKFEREFADILKTGRLNIGYAQQLVRIAVVRQ